MRECESGIRVCSLQNREMKNARVKVIIRSGVPEVVLADGDVDVHSNYRRHKLNIDNEHITHEIPDGFKVKPAYRSLMYTASGEPIGDPRWLK